MDKQSLIMGWLVGRRIAGQRKQKGKVPVAYLYNGVRLPPLPQWDREKYPYALIAYGGSGLVGAKNYQLTCSGAPFVWESDYGLSAPTAGYAYSLYYDGNADWGKVYESASAASANTGSGRTAIWANHDVYLTGGALHLAASDPVPIYDNNDDPDVVIPARALVSSDGYILTDSSGRYLISKEDS